MDCLKNLTACLGCTKKHAKCSWKDVTDEELRDYVPPEPKRDEIDDGISERSSSQPVVEEQVKRDYAQDVRDEELLGEEESDDSISDAEEPDASGQHPPIQVHVAGSLQSASGAPIERDDSDQLDVDVDVDVDVEMEPEVQQDIADLQAEEPPTLPSPPGAPIPPPASLPELPTIRSEAPPDVNVEEQKDLVPRMSPSQVSYDSSEYGTFSSVNGTSHGLPNPHIDLLRSDQEPFDQPDIKPQTEVVYPSISAPMATMAPMASMKMGSPVGRTEA